MSSLVLTGKCSKTTSQTQTRSTTHASSLRHSNKEVWNSPTSFQNSRCLLIRWDIPSGIRNQHLPLRKNRHLFLRLSRLCWSGQSTPSSSTGWWCQSSTWCSPTTMSSRHLPCMVIKSSKNNDRTRPCRVLQPLPTTWHPPPPPLMLKTRSPVTGPTLCQRDLRESRWTCREHKHQTCVTTAWKRPCHFKDSAKREEGIHMPGPMQVLWQEAGGEWTCG